MNAGAPRENVRDTKRCCVARQLAGEPPHGVQNARNKIFGTRVLFVRSGAVETSLIFPENSYRSLDCARDDRKRVPARSPRSPGLFQIAKCTPCSPGLNK